MAREEHNHAGASEDIEEQPELRRRVSGSLLICLIASVIEFATAADFCDTSDSCDDPYVAWAIAVGVISAFFCFVRLAFIFQHFHLRDTFDVVLSLVLVVLWAFGAAFNTSTEGPFPFTGNGYIFTWIAFLAAMVYAATALPHAVAKVRATVVAINTSLLILLFTSLVEMSVSADVCSAVDDCSDRNGFAVAVGAASAAICFILILIARFSPDLAQPSMKIMSVFLLVWWAAGAGVNTSAEGPFNSSCGAARGTANACAFESCGCELSTTS
ncbi:hypothetical protein PTSG_05217 [Salpingoeca rosetta]|uniref:MARVEL domain-containing protein n=1 Tax=Salpingoeca rosetta (strain ATCC 50818 / BSB-021) TaxID=946362 RepID=F2UAU7_SALR5|nr:uncharacterized protein PTSG_05217 [Salpingoeca rosetta]EGD73513.1 hypothetical protein PTSG_05217 [Salpingoeca rosetta]|eukprot:XP_004993795.1 hypothetical protein PTSG_05217 [Salpingoeca rosetta]